MEIFDNIIDNLPENTNIKTKSYLLHMKNEYERVSKESRIKTFLKHYIEFKKESKIRKEAIYELWSENPDKAINYGLVKLREMTDSTTGEIEKVPIIDNKGDIILIDPVDKEEFNSEIC